MEVRVKKNRSGVQRFRFPDAEADLPDDLLKSIDMVKPLQKLGRRLCRQLKVPAVKFNRITFTVFDE